MNTVLISTKGQIVLPVSVRSALGLKPGMRVNVEVDGKSARLTSASASASASAKTTVTLTEIQALLQYRGPVVAIATMRADRYKS